MNGTLFYALIDRFQRNNSQSLFRFLPKKMTLHEPWKKVEVEEIFNPRRDLEEIHYSWFPEILEQLPSESLPLLKTVFSQDQKKGLLSQFPGLGGSSEASLFTTNYLSQWLKKQVFPTNLLLLENLPPSSLNALLLITKPTLISIIDLLGIHDLASDLRKILDKTLLNKIHESLTREQLLFLHYCMKQEIRFPSPPLPLAEWDGNAKKLNILLHQRGLVRLAYALSDEHTSLQWHVVHRLDTGREKS